MQNNSPALTAKKNLKRWVFLQTLSALLILVLIAWWGTLLNNYSNKVRDLEIRLGGNSEEILSKHDRVQSMIFWESTTLLLILLGSNGALIFFTWRDYRRQKSIQAFFASVTHELRTPLTGIRLQAEAISDQVREFAADAKFGSLQKWVSRMLSDVSRLEGQVQRTLELARVEGGGTLLLTPLLLDQVFEKWKIQSGLFTPEDFSLKIEGQSQAVFADTGALSVIFRNIFENAAKYSISKPAEVLVKFQDHNVVFTHLNPKLDSGTIAFGQLFARGQNSSGAGVGLYLVAALMKRMNGSVSFVANNHFEVFLSFSGANSNDT